MTVDGHGLRDKRVTPARADLAAESLRGHVEADRFTGGTRQHVTAALADLRREPDRDASLDTQLLFGEAVTTFDERNGWSWVQSERDGYVGYVPTGSLTDGAARATHRVVSNRSFVYPAPDMKRPIAAALPMNAHVAVTETAGAFARVELGWMFAAHLTELQEAAADYVAVAERMVNTPYLWGGKSPAGIDCSGLVQLALAMANIPFPRDSDMQENASVPIDRPRLDRGDLAFWKGHVGILSGSSTLLHANAHHMLVIAEPLLVAEARIDGADRNGSAPTFRRITGVYQA